LVIEAFGRAARSAAISAALTGAEPIRTNFTLEKSVRASKSRSRSIMAIIGGTAVSRVQR
jgi:hypothetical protein